MISYTTNNNGGTQSNRLHQLANRKGELFFFVSGQFLLLNWSMRPHKSGSPLIVHVQIVSKYGINELFFFPPHGIVLELNYESNIPFIRIIILPLFIFTCRQLI
jgi:hypothetical protein